MIDPSLGRKHHKPTCAPPVRPLSQNRDFVILWVSQSISALGSAVSSVGFVLLTLTITGSAAHAGAVASIAAITAVVCRLPAGSLADRRDRRIGALAFFLGPAANASIIGYILTHVD